MSVLSDVSLRACLDSGRLVVSPLGEGAVQPSSVDLHLGALVRMARRDGSYVDYDLTKRDGLWLYQLDFALAATLESVRLADDLAGQLAGKSTTARWGLIVESAGFVDPGWSGELTLELTNLSPAPVRLTHGMAICQLVLARLTTTCERPYGSDGLGSHYQHSIGPVVGVVEHMRAGGAP